MGGSPSFQGTSVPHVTDFTHPLTRNSKIANMCAKLQTDKVAQEQFINYLRDQSWLDKIQLYKAAKEETIQTIQEKSGSNANIIQFNEYVVSPAPTPRPVDGSSTPTAGYGYSTPRSTSRQSTPSGTPAASPAASPAGGSARKGVPPLHLSSSSSGKPPMKQRALDVLNGVVSSDSESDSAFENDLQAKMSVLQKLKFKEGTTIDSFKSPPAATDFSPVDLLNILMVVSAEVYCDTMTTTNTSAATEYMSIFGDAIIEQKQPGPTDSSIKQISLPSVAGFDIGCDLRGIRRIQQTLKSALKSASDADLKIVMNGGQWVDGSMHAVDRMPLSVMVSANISGDYEISPLVYVNKGFETLTLYNSAEVLGKTPEFLQNDNTEKDQVELMKQKRKELQSCKVVVNNVKKDGSDFVNLLSVSPVFDKVTKKCIYFVGSLYDASHSLACMKDIKTIDNNMALIRFLLQ